jgi:hypothetical protein
METERRIRDNELLQLVCEKKKQHGDLQNIPRRQTSQYWDSGNTGHRH